MIHQLRRCPACGALTSETTHCFVKGPPLFPQMDDYTLTEPCEAVTVEDLRSDEAVERAAQALDNAPEFGRHGPFLDADERRSVVRAVLSAAMTEEE